VSILANVRPALSLFWRQVWRSRRPDTPDHVPDYPLRCQHCEEPIVLVKGNFRSPLYRDPTGVYGCGERRAIPHKPMPSVL
jgi:hypothetical protein